MKSMVLDFGRDAWSSCWQRGAGERPLGRTVEDAGQSLTQGGKENPLKRLTVYQFFKKKKTRHFKARKPNRGKCSLPTPSVSCSRRGNEPLLFVTDTKTNVGGKKVTQICMVVGLVSSF